MMRIPLRRRTIGKGFFNSRETELRKLYCDKKMTLREIAAHYDCHWGGVHKALVRFGIPLRSVGYPSQRRAMRAK